MFEAPYPPYDPSDTASFSYTTVLKRWPIILTSVIDNIYRFNHDLDASIPSLESGSEDLKLIEERISEGKAIIEKISKLKYEMARDRALEPIPDDGEAMVEEYNTELARLAQQGKHTWFQAPWLFAECYLYRLLRSYFTQTKQWRTYDPFLSQKQDTFQKSSKAIFQLATTMHELEADKQKLASDADALNVIFKEMIQMCLWGNATDLSMLTQITHDDIQNLQSVGRDAQAARKQYILRDDQDKVWAHLQSLSGSNGSRVDFVLDNAGFELFTDFVFADFLVTYTPYVSKVVFHPKLIPWFVSDVTPPDFKAALESLLSPTFFPSSSGNTEWPVPPVAQAPEPRVVQTPPDLPESRNHLRVMVERWQKYLEEGVFQLSVPLDTPLGASHVKANFWTSPWPYWNMKELAKDVHDSLHDSGLVIFKGDLNFRRLTGDVRWPAHTPFSTALGPLAGAFPILSLRTNKADVVVGVDKDVADRLDDSGEQWRYNGKYALVAFLPCNESQVAGAK
ncbi:hypothetical protein CERSUDRAFT_116552 [Gelatoporia subvermispora B]|uniref:Sugar phosphate phosphatase n=1 Tax=Ceriporiopsis subvermispora (strain B) TaxID=914234 RepID=M2R8M1_CERS8|nr:hypothetical protein CERSUDRAFT_116552 [Gelatoporia subvermispora B]